MSSFHAQISEGLNYHYRSDWYYDSVFFKSVWEDYVRLENNLIYEGRHQVLEGMLFDLDTTENVKGINENLKLPYSLFLKNDTVFINLNYGFKNTDTIIPYFPTRLGDTIKHVVDLNYLNFKSSSKWISRSGNHIYVGDTTIEVLNQKHKCYLIKFKESGVAADKLSDITKLLFVDKSSFLTLRSEWTYNISQTEQVRPCYKNTYIDSVSSRLEPFNYFEDEIIWEDTTHNWSNHQKIRFKEDCIQWAQKEKNCDCIIEELSTNSNYFKIMMLSVWRTHEISQFIESLEMCDD